MKHRKAVSFLCLVLAACLSSCGFIGPIETENPEQSFPPIVVHSKDPNATEAPPPANTDSHLSGNETATPGADPYESTGPAPATPAPGDLIYDPNYHLEGVEIPPLLANGLETPIDGATGFASVNLPVWPAYPGDNARYKLTSYTAAGVRVTSTPAPAPTTAPTTAPTPAPATPAPTPEPATEAPATQEPATAPPVTDPPVTEPPVTEAPVTEAPVTEAPATEPPVETPAPAPEPTVEPAPATEAPENPENPEGGDAGAAGVAEPVSRNTKFYQMVKTAQTQTLGATTYPGAMAVLVPGTGFEILEERGDWWRISFVDQNSVFGEALTEGWIEHRYCFINLPDVIPSILYNDTNCSGSIFVSCGKEIPGVTGNSFYNTQQYNVRLARTEYIMPMLYIAAKDVAAAQHKALAQGNCLEIYQTFRPYETQIAVANAVAAMAQVDPEVKAGISTYPWSISWFIATGTSNHQIGFALDVTIVKMNAAEIKQCGNYPYIRCTSFERYTMPTPMHELSMAAASQRSPVDTTLAPGMNDCALALRSYFISSGFTPLASEWWHFNDPVAQLSTTARPSDGKYFTEECYSAPPK